jgi:hypothetical protein
MKQLFYITYRCATGTWHTVIESDSVEQAKQLFCRLHPHVETLSVEACE